MSELTTNKLSVSWRDVTLWSQMLAQHLDNMHSFDAIVAIGKGGIIPAAIVQQLLGITDLIVISASSYRSDNTQEDEVEINHDNVDKGVMFGLASLGDRLLVIDDIYDSGKTIEAFQSTLFPNATYGVMVYKDTKGYVSEKVVSGAILSLRPDVWVIFPWEPESR